MGVDVLRWDGFRSVPWKNGGGTTREVASGVLRGTPAQRTPTDPAPASGEPVDAFDWRVSVADVAAEGAFSSFPGVDRVITVVEGAGMVLTVDGMERKVGPLGPFAFPGDAATDCRPAAGPVRNANVMTRRGRATAAVRVVPLPAAPGSEVACAADETLLVVAATEGIALVGPGGGGTALGRLDCVRHEGPKAPVLRGEGTVVEIRIGSVR
ncbi:HutD family protein [Streptomyces sp. NPDC005865]|uniref:HutD/Ves family protein n=1 Tax=Streptomyces sp. NPDC005865 TaxID=3155453 RepID=UPI0033D70D01